MCNASRTCFPQANTTFGVDPVNFINTWLNTRSADMAAIGKPLVVEEFGKQLPVPSNASVIAETRDRIFRAIYSALQNLENVKGQH